MKKLLAPFLCIALAGSAHAQRLYEQTQEPPGTTLYAKGYGVKADGVTSDDVALKRAVDACNTVGGHLILPPGTILLNGSGTTHILLDGCWMQGSNGSAAFQSHVSGTTFNLTSTTVTPFYLQKNWSITDVSFYYPNQTGSLVTYPTLFADNGTTSMTNGVFDRTTVINAYDIITVNAANGAGQVKILNSTWFAVHWAINGNLFGQSWLVSGVRFSPSPWAALTQLSAGFLASINPGMAQNAVIHAKTNVSGQGITITMAGGTIAFGWRYFMLLDSDGVIANSTFDIDADGIGTYIDSSSGGIYSTSNRFKAGIATLCQAFAYPANPGGSALPCFNLGAGSGLRVDNSYFEGASGNFITATGGTNGIFLDNITVAQIGAFADGSDYYFLNATGSTESLRMNSCVIKGPNPADAHTHGIKYNTANPFSDASLVMKNNIFTFMTDILTVNTINRQVLDGNVSMSSYASGNSLNITGLGKWIGQNFWDTDPIAAPAVIPSADAPQSIWNWGVPAGIGPSGFFANNGIYVIGQAPSASATASFSATSGSVTLTMSAATLLGTALDVGRVLTILDTTYKYCTITAQSSTTVATCTISGGTLSGTGPFANNILWLSGSPSTLANATAFSVPLPLAFPSVFFYFDVNVICTAANCGGGASQAAGIFYATCESTTVCTIKNPPGISSGTAALALGKPFIPASTTGYTSTGSGAFTQTTSTKTILTFRIPGNSLGPQGALMFEDYISRPTTANAITFSTTFGATQSSATSVVSTQWYGIHRTIRNAGATNSQVMMNTSSLTATSDLASANTAPLYLAIDTTANQNLIERFALATATDFAFITSGLVTETYGATN